MTVVYGNELWRYQKKKPKQEIEPKNTSCLTFLEKKNEYQEQDVHEVFTASLCFHSAVW